MKRLLLILMTMVAAVVMSSAAFSQSQIDKEIKTIIKSHVNQDDVYSVRRNPSTGKIFKEVRIIRLVSYEASKIIKAMNESAPNSTSFECINNQCYSIVFEKGTVKRLYTLSRDGRSWTLIVEMNDAGNKPAGKRHMRFDPECDDEPFGVEYNTGYNPLTL